MDHVAAAVQGQHGVHRDGLVPVPVVLVAPGVSFSCVVRLILWEQSSKTNLFCGQLSLKLIVHHV